MEWYDYFRYAVVLLWQSVLEGHALNTLILILGALVVLFGCMALAMIVCATVWGFFEGIKLKQELVRIDKARLQEIRDHNKRLEMQDRKAHAEQTKIEQQRLALERTRAEHPQA